jgi:hypothetical protein
MAIALLVISRSESVSVRFVWNKVNQSGRTVARGLYYVVLRVEETEGGGTVLQTVKKVLVP